MKIPCNIYAKKMFEIYQNLKDIALPQIYQIHLFPKVVQKTKMGEERDSPFFFPGCIYASY